MNTNYARIHLRHLRLIHAVAQTGQVSHAAEALGISQPAASRSLNELESIVGEALFTRHPKGMSLTAAGRIIADNASGVLECLKSAEYEIEALKTGLAGKVRVGALAGPAARYLVPAVIRLKAIAQALDIRVDVDTSQNLTEGLLRGQYDLVMARIPQTLDPRRFNIVQADPEDMRFLTRRGHPLQGRGPVELKDLMDLTWLIQGRGRPIREALEKAFLKRNLRPPEDCIETTSLIAVLAYLEKSNAIAVVSREVGQLLANGTGNTVIDLALEQRIELPPYHMLTIRNKPLNPAAERLHDLLFAELIRPVGP